MEIEFDELLSRFDSPGFWREYLSEAVHSPRGAGIHLAVFSEPFLSLVIDGTKTVESRLSKVRCAPFGDISDGDIILIKGVAGPICGIALAKSAWCVEVTPKSLEKIRDDYGQAICADSEFWEGRADASFATLIELAEPMSIRPMRCDKRDRRGWVSIKSRQLSLAF